MPPFFLPKIFDFRYVNWRPALAMFLATSATLGLSGCSSTILVGSAPHPVAVASPAGPAGLTCPRPQTRFAGYDREARAAFWTMYRSGGNTIYCDAPFDGGARRTARSSLPVNIEHVVPQAHMKRVRAAGGDPHNLWPSILEVNAARQHWRLVENIPDETGFFAGRKEPELNACDFELQNTATEPVVEPALAARGLLARAMLHMLLAYPAIRVRPGEAEQFLEWHAAHPVSDEERRRNELIERLTGVRNVFVDSPELGEAIVKACRAAKATTPGLEGSRP